MFFIMGINNGEKKLDFIQNFICDKCGKYSSYEVYMTYMTLSLFFIPIFKWGKHYYAKKSCCGAVYEISKEVGRSIEKGENIEITEKDLMNKQFGYKENTCYNCGYALSDEFDFCPKCGNRVR